MRFDYDFNENDYQDEFETVPAGNYLAKIINSEDKQTKAGDGEYLELKIQIIDGKYKGKFIFDRLNLVNPNQQAMNIAKATLGNIMRAVKIETITDTDCLFGLPLVIKIVHNEYEGKTYANVKGYASAEGFNPDDLGAGAEPDSYDINSTNYDTPY